MPRNLPGMYWDEAKKRYFPLSSRPRQIPSSIEGPFGATSSRHSTPQQQSNEPSESQCSSLDRPRKRRRVENISSMEPSRGWASLRFADRSRAVHDITAQNISSLSEGKPVSYGNIPFSSLHVTRDLDGRYVASTGDKGGWLQTYRMGPRGSNNGSSRELYLGSKVTAVCCSETHRLAVSFGPSSKIAVENTAQDAELWTIMSIADNECHDVRSAHLLGNSLALGAAKRGILLPDIEAGWGFEVLPTGSDVFSIYQLDHLVYTGTRSGSIKCFDKRLSTRQKGQELLGGRFQAAKKSITHLNVINNWQLLVSTITGDLELHDLRFARETTPFMEFQGHYNNYQTELGIAVSPCQSFVFAAGQDQRIRAWSLRTGALISPQSNPTGKLQTHLFHHQFPDNVAAMQITDGSMNGYGSDGGGLSLWAVCGGMIYRYWLGQRMVGISL